MDLKKMSVFLLVCCKYAAICSKPGSITKSTVFFLFGHTKIRPYTNFQALQNLQQYFANFSH